MAPIGSFRNAEVSSVPTTSFRALSATTMSLVSRRLKRTCSSTGMIAAGSVEARMAPSRIAIPGPSANPRLACAAPSSQEKAKPVISTPGKASRAILMNSRMKSRNGISRPPLNRIIAAQPVTSVARTPRSCTMGANSLCPAMPSAMATTNDGSAAPRVT